MLLAALSATAGCKTLGLDDGTTLTLVSTTPPGALVRIPGFGECETPCTIEIDQPREILIAKAGFDPKRVTLTPGKKRVDIVLDLSAPTTGVDETALPDL